MHRVLFVCLGNICRSPIAEAAFRRYVESIGQGAHFSIDSAGTSAYHEGELPDRGSIHICQQRGLDIRDQRSRPVRSQDAEDFDYIIAMDTRNLRDLQKNLEVPPERMFRIRELDPEAHDSLDVPDPYGGGANGFRDVYEMLERSMPFLYDLIVSGSQGG